MHEAKGKGADQMCNHCTVDLCFRMCEKEVFSSYDSVGIIKIMLHLHIFTIVDVIQLWEYLEIFYQIIFFLIQTYV